MLTLPLNDNVSNQMQRIEKTDKTDKTEDVEKTEETKNNENKYVLPEFPLTDKISENVYISKSITKMYVVKYLNSDDHAFMKEIELTNFLSQGPQFVFNHSDTAGTNAQIQKKRNICKLMCCCANDDALIDESDSESESKGISESLSESLIESLNEFEFELGSMNGSDEQNKEENDTFDSRYLCGFVMTKENEKENEKEKMRYLITEYSGKDMYDFVSDNKHGFTEMTIKIIFYQLVHAVNALHSLGFVHGDLSPENICVQGFQELEPKIQDTIEDRIFKIKIIDFAFALIHPESPYYDIYKKYENYEKVKIHNTHNTSEFITSMRRDLFDTEKCYLGKVFYMSPERFSAHTQDTVYCSYKDDVYALGIILYSFIFGTLPYRKPSEKSKVFRNVINGTWKRKLTKETYKPNHIIHRKHPGHRIAIDLIDKILKYESKRIGTNDILAHQWFDDVRDKIDFIYD